MTSRMAVRTLTALAMPHKSRIDANRHRDWYSPGPPVNEPGDGHPNRQVGQDSPSPAVELRPRKPERQRRDHGNDGGDEIVENDERFFHAEPPPGCQEPNLSSVP